MKIFSDENSGKSFLDITPKGKKKSIKYNQLYNHFNWKGNHYQN